MQTLSLDQNGITLVQQMTLLRPGKQREMIRRFPLGTAQIRIHVLLPTSQLEVHANIGKSLVNLGSVLERPPIQVIHDESPYVLHLGIVYGGEGITYIFQRQHAPPPDRSFVSNPLRPILRLDPNGEMGAERFLVAGHERTKGV